MMKEVTIACRMSRKVKLINGSSAWMELSDFDEPFDKLMVLSTVEGLSRVAVSHQLSAKHLFLMFFDEY
jgi:hypothetical protein